MERENKKIKNGVYSEMKKRNQELTKQEKKFMREVCFKNMEAEYKALLYEEIPQIVKLEEELFHEYYKTCPECGEIKSRSEYFKDKRRSDGIYTYCKKCQNEKYGKKNQKAYRERQKLESDGFYVYFIFDEHKNLAYVGQTTNMKTRMTSHYYGRVSATADLFLNNNVSLIEYIEVNTKEEIEALEVLFINNKKQDLKEPRISTFDLYGEYIIEAPYLNINRGAGQADRNLLVKVFSKLRNHEYAWQIWQEFDDFGDEDDE